MLQYLRTVLVKRKLPPLVFCSAAIAHTNHPDGASLIYTTPNIPSQLPTLIHACLGVTSLLKRQPLKPEVIKRNEVVVPSNWDSWTKILVVREGFEVDKVSEGWSMDLQRPFPPAGSRYSSHADSANGRRSNGNGSDAASPKQHAAASIPPTATTGIDGDVVESGEYSYDGPSADDEHDDAISDLDYDDGAGGLADEDPDSAVSQFERTIRDPGMDVLALVDQYNEAAAGDDEDDEDDDEDYADGDGAHDRDFDGHGKSHSRRRKGRKGRRQQLEVETEDVQLFLGDQLKLLDQLRQKDDAKRDKEAKDSKRRGDGSGSGYNSNSHGNSSGSTNNHASDAADPAEVISSHIGPVQFNIGGIQVDADDMLERIKNRHYGTASPEPLSPELGKASLALAGGGSDAGSVAGSSVAGASSKAQRARPAGGKDPADLTSVDAENLTAFFAGLMNRPSQASQQAPKS